MSKYLTMREGIEWLKQKGAILNKWDGGIDYPTIHLHRPDCNEVPSLRVSAFHGLEKRGYLTELPPHEGQNPFVRRFKLNHVGKRILGSPQKEAEGG